MAEEAMKKTEKGHSEAQRMPYQRSQRGRVSKEKGTGWFYELQPRDQEHKKEDNHSVEAEGSSEDTHLKLTHIRSS